MRGNGRKLAGLRVGWCGRFDGMRRGGEPRSFELCELPFWSLFEKFCHVKRFVDP